VIARLTARNFRSLEGVGLDFDPQLAAIVGARANVFTCSPSLESELGIGRWAKDEPRRAAAAISARDQVDWPKGVIRALERLFAPTTTG
jgi:hypothetical protein